MVSFQEQKQEGDVFDSVRKRLRNGEGRIRQAGPDYLAYSLLDAVVDGYFGVVEQLGEQVEEVEEELVRDPCPDTLRLIYAAAPPSPRAAQGDLAAAARWSPSCSAATRP